MVEGLWLKVAAGLPDSDNARVLQRRLEVDRAWSYALSTWDWFVRKHPEGQLVGPDAAYLIAQGAGWTGDADKFCASMVAAGYLAPIPEGFRVRGWSEWAGYHLEVRAKDKAKKKAVRKGQSKGRPGDVPGTSRGQVQEKAASEGVCPGDPSLLSTLGSGSSGSEGVQGEAPDPAAEKWPLVAACLAALWERKRDALWPKERETADRLERAVAAVGLPAAIEALDASLEADPAHPWLGWHLDALKAKPKRQKAEEPPPALDPSWLSSLPVDARGRAEAAWSERAAHVRYSAYPDALPRLLAQAREEFQATWQEVA